MRAPAIGRSSDDVRFAQSGSGHWGQYGMLEWKVFLEQAPVGGMTYLGPTGIRLERGPCLRSPCALG